MRIYQLILIIFCFVGAYGQNVESDSLKKLLATTKDESKRIYVLEGLSYAYLSTSPDTALQYATEGLHLAERSNDVRGQAFCTTALGNVFFAVGDYSKALDMYLHSLQLKEGLENQRFAVNYFNIANVYTEQRDFRNALVYVLKAKKEDEKEKDSAGVLFDMYSLSANYLRMNYLDSAMYYNQQAYAYGNRLHDKNMIGAILNNFGGIQIKKGNIPLALKYYQQSIPFAAAINDYEVLSADFLGIAKIHKETKRSDSAIHYARKALRIVREAPFLKQVYENNNFLADIFKGLGKFDSAFKYMELSLAARDSLFNTEKVRKIQNLKLQEQERQQEIEASALSFQNKVKFYSVFFVSIVFLAIAVLLWRNNKQRQKGYAQLELQKIKTEQAYEKLKSTQTQLIHSEKMASLGELTAGIAHEIQNPLNFVNNFSEVNSELIDELKDEIKSGNTEHLLTTLNNISENEQKIIHHGKRADSIVKGMLQHSRISTGQKELTDINTLADEYLRLAYHGLRAKDKTFNAKFETEFDVGIGKMNIMPQEIGRVILNLVNNAFYAILEKRIQNIPGYEPLIIVSTKKTGDEILISIKDNGIGIQQKVVDKIFHPFFTTKPAGQGTGLGLSISYDIIKAHNGKIQIITSEGEGTEFIIRLPVENKTILPNYL